MNLQFFNIGSFDFTLNINATSAPFGSADAYLNYVSKNNLYGTSNKIYNSCVVKNFSITAAGIPGLRKPNTAYGRLAYIHLVKVPSDVVYIKGSSETINQEDDPILWGRLKTYYGLPFIDFNTFFDLNLVLDNIFVNAYSSDLKEYIAPYYKLQLIAGVPHTGTPTIIYDNLNIDPSYHERPTHLDIMFNVEVSK